MTVIPIRKNRPSLGDRRSRSAVKLSQVVKEQSIIRPRCGDDGEAETQIPLPHEACFTELASDGIGRTTQVRVIAAPDDSYRTPHFPEPGKCGLTVNSDQGASNSRSASLAERPEVAGRVTRFYDYRSWNRPGR